jgi:hypothetical protein
VSSARLWLAASHAFRCDSPERLVDGRRVARPDEASGFTAVGEEHKGRPELDAVRAAKRLAAAVLDLDVANAGMCFQRVRDHRPGGAAVTAPGVAELEQRRAGQGIDRNAARLARGSIDLRVHGIGAANDAPHRL